VHGADLVWLGELHRRMPEPLAAQQRVAAGQQLFEALTHLCVPLQTFR
jgi:hypothetical protein